MMFDGFNPDSPTLARSYTAGDCLGDAWRDCEIWLDPAAPIRSGDYVRLHLRYDDGAVERVVKQLRCSRAGARWPGDPGRAWWGACDDGCFQLGTLVVPSAIEKVVARRGLVYPVALAPNRHVADAATRAHFADLARGAVAEWEREGSERGVPFPGLDAVTYRETSA